jgi:hypothetical protein
MDVGRGSIVRGDSIWSEGESAVGTNELSCGAEERSGDCSSTIRTAVVARWKYGRGSSSVVSLGRDL